MKSTRRSTEVAARTTPEQLAELIYLIGMIQHREVNQYAALLHRDNVRQVDRDKRTLLHIAAAQLTTDALEAIFPLQPLVDAQDKKGRTALMYAAELNRADNVELLLAHGASVDIQNNFGNSALWGAIYSARGELTRTVSLLLQAGANVHSRGLHGSSCLEYAEQGGSPALLDALRAAPHT